MINIKPIENKSSFLIAKNPISNKYSIYYDLYYHCSLDIKLNILRNVQINKLKCAARINTSRFLRSNDRKFFLEVFIDCCDCLIHEKADCAINCDLPGYFCVQPQGYISNIPKFKLLHFYNMFCDNGCVFYLNRPSIDNVTLEFNIFILKDLQKDLNLKFPIFCNNPVDFYSKNSNLFLQYRNNEKFFFLESYKNQRNGTGFMFYDSSKRMFTRFMDDNVI